MCIRYQRDTYKIYRSLRLLRRTKFTGNIFVNPPVSLVSDRVKIWGTGYEPFSPITIKATAQCEPERLSFISYAHYITCEDGQFDLATTLATTHSVGGSYSGNDGMGLFWSMVETEHSISRFQMNNATIPLKYEFSVFSGHYDDANCERDLICRASIRRSFLSHDVTRRLIRKGDMQGTLFIPPGDGPFPAIITIHGGLKRRRIVEDAAAMLANNGFVSLALAFYGYDGLPQKYVDNTVHIEYFEEVVKYLSLLECVDGDAIGVYGASKGGDISIAMASFLPGVKSVVWVNGSVGSLASETIYGNNVFPDIGFDLSKLAYLPDGTAVLKNCYNNIYDGHPSVYPLGNSLADILFVVGLDDLCLPTEVYAEFARKRMEAAGKTNFEIVKCNGMGHLVDLPFVPPCSIAAHPLKKDVLFNYGGGGKNKELHAMHVVSVWTKILSFFKASLLRKV